MREGSGPIVASIFAHNRQRRSARAEDVPKWPESLRIVEFMATLGRGA